MLELGLSILVISDCKCIAFYIIQVLSELGIFVILH